LIAFTKECLLKGGRKEPKEGLLIGWLIWRGDWEEGLINLFCETRRKEAFSY